MHPRSPLCGRYIFRSYGSVGAQPVFQLGRCVRRLQSTFSPQYHRWATKRLVLPGSDQLQARRQAQRRSDRLNTGDNEVLSLTIAQVQRLRLEGGSKEFQSFSGLSDDTTLADLEAFCSHLESSLSEDPGQGSTWKSSSDYLSIREAYERQGQPGIVLQLRNLLRGYMSNKLLESSDAVNRNSLTDLRYPYEWYHHARSMNRTIHLHIGPTNSGKTYHALKRLEQAKTGVYGGPLRLLAHEVYRRLNANGKPCNLITGDERIISSEDAGMSSCTVEMLPVSLRLEVAVVDEIQMIGDDERGWAWTQAFLGLCADEVHLCGEERALPLIRELSAACGDTLHVHRYQRLTPLKTMSKSLRGDLTRLQKGDCVVMFSRRGIHAMKQEIERCTGKQVAVVYGSLPPEIRAQQAKLFNETDNDYDILVASDAVGMGLNLNIKRIVFESTSKMMNGKFEPLSTSSIKQISGRAGRFRVATDSLTDTKSPLEISAKPVSDNPPDTQSSVGLVTSLDQFDLPAITRAMRRDAEPIVSAGLYPPDDLIIRYASFFPENTPLSYILHQLYESSKLHSRFHLCQVSSSIKIADAIQDVQGISLSDRLVFCAAPFSEREPTLVRALNVFARCVENQSGGALLDLPVFKLELLEQHAHDSNYLHELELLHKAIILYLWLSYRFSGVFISKDLAFYVRGLVEEKIDRALADATITQQTRARMRKLRRRNTLRDLKSQHGGMQDSTVDRTVPHTA